MKNSVNIIILEDNSYYNQFITKELHHFVNNYPSKSIYNIKFYSFTDPMECINKIKDNDLLKNDTIFFLDYYVGKVINGAHLYQIITGLNRNARVVILSKSRSAYKKMVGKFGKNSYFDFVIKDEYTPVVCGLHIEQFLENLVVS
jgi:hypothetical protein